MITTATRIQKLYAARRPPSSKPVPQVVERPDHAVNAANGTGRLVIATGVPRP